MAITRSNDSSAANRPDEQNRLRESVRKAVQRPEAPPSEYHWDAFISYHRDPDFDRWMTKVFGILKQNLANYLGGKANIFIDVRDIELGDRWTDELKDALRRSKCLIPFIEPAMLTVANWLATRVQTRTPVPSAASLWNQYRRFQAELPRIARAAKMREKDIAYYDVVLMIREWLEASGTRS